ncbi:MAG TPA: iron-containing alcohol dehydrogenase, partial [Pseudomonadales bacterium]|nr:iron-containing alcohol dehydrogenase [Pseudomonadales bacterium]
MNFTYANPTQILFGQGRVADIANLINPAVKVLLVYGGGSIKQNGIYQQITAALSHHQWVEFSGVESNPTIETLDRAVALARSEKIGFILAAGGGSVIDGCKYIAAAVGYEGDGWDIVIRKHKVKSALPIGVVLTLPATGSESNNNSVITRQSTHQKNSFASPALQPVFAVLDPDVMKTLPEKQLANGIVDAFVHVCEQYITVPTGAWVQEGYAEVLLRNLIKLAEQFSQRDNDEWRSNLMFTANQALNGLVGAGVPQDWATHIIGHELTALHGVDHARTLS